MKTLILASLAFAASIARASDSTVDDSDWREGPSKEWFVNWDKALAESKKTNRPIFALKTGSDWCGWCKRLKADVLDTDQFKEFAANNLVLLYVDSPMKDPLGKAQSKHNKQLSMVLRLGGGVPNVLLFSHDGKKLGGIGGGGQKVDEYLARLKNEINKEGVPLKDVYAQTLFTDGYAKMSADIAAELAKLPPVSKEDFKASVTGVAMVDRNGNKPFNEIEFAPPETAVAVQDDKRVIYRVEYEIPEGHTAAMYLSNGRYIMGDGSRKRPAFTSDRKNDRKGKGVFYGEISLYRSPAPCTLEEVCVSAVPDAGLDVGAERFTICRARVHVDYPQPTGK